MLPVQSGPAFASWRRPSRLRRVALGLWMAWAVAVWHVVFDYVIVMAGRGYVHAAGVAALEHLPAPVMDDWMRPAATRGLVLATTISVALAGAGLLAVRAATRAAGPVPAEGAL